MKGGTPLIDYLFILFFVQQLLVYYYKTWFKKIANVGIVLLSDHGTLWNGSVLVLFSKEGETAQIHFV